MLFKTKNKMKNIFRVNTISSERTTTREKLDAHTIEDHVGDYQTKEEAIEVYEATGTGMEVDKELLFIDEEKNIYETILTTY